MCLSGQHAYWSGYFTSRSAFKLHERVNGAFLQGARQLDVNKDLGGQEDLLVLARALGAAQHHDAITGTAKAAVDDDYHQRLSRGHLAAQRLMSGSIFAGATNPPLDMDILHTCPWLNVTSCSWTMEGLQESNILMSVYNPRPRTQDIFTRLTILIHLHTTSE